MSQPLPVKRGPGRPRKYPLPEQVPAAVREPELVTDKKPSAHTDTSEPGDPRIGLEVHPNSTAVGFDDGSQYRAVNGFIVEKLN